ncbi:MAG: DinB family protein [Gemmatimonadota bacterium]|nr:DinB family protein [Gemmatimonadota bacterium]
MTRSKITALAALAVVTLAAPAAAQHEGQHEGQQHEHAAALAIRDEMLGQFGNSSFKMDALSQAMPADLYDWAPQEGLMTVGVVYAHIARYNFMYLEENLGIPAPEGVDWQNLESLTDKDQIVAALKTSIDHVNAKVAALSEHDLNMTTPLYGREVSGWAVLVQLVAHMNEHVGQAVAYARMNDVTPPWSR